MPLAELLMPEFHNEMKTTRAALHALPEDKGDYKSHVKSMTLAKLAGHTALMPGFISMILTGPDLDLAVTKFPPLLLESRAQIGEAFDGMVAKAAAELQGLSDASLAEPWKLLVGDLTIFAGSRYEAYRVFGMNHMIHHRAQLGVYLRLLDLPVPSTYGPSADTAS